MIYVYVCFSSVLFAHLASRAKNKVLRYIFSVISVLIPCILGGLRATGVGGDSALYGLPDALDALQAPDMETFVFRGREIGYRFVCYVMVNTFGHENWCYFAYQIITLTCVYIGAYKHKDKLSLPLIMFVWFTLFYSESYNAIRQSMASAIIFMNMDQLEQKHYFKFALTIAFAALFHTSALAAWGLLIGIHVVTTSKTLDRNFWLKLIVFYGSLAMFSVLIPIMTYVVSRFPIFAKYNGYAIRAIQGGIGISISMVFFGEMLMLVLYGRGAPRIFTTNGIKNFEFYKYSLMFCVAFMFILRFGLGNRLLMYQYYANTLLLAAVPRFVKEKHLRFLVMMILVAVLAYYWWHIHVFRFNSGVWPYRSIL